MVSFLVCEDGGAEAEIDIGRCQIAEALVVVAVIAARRALAYRSHRRPARRQDAYETGAQGTAVSGRRVALVQSRHITWHTSLYERRHLLEARAWRADYSDPIGVSELGDIA